MAMHDETIRGNGHGADRDREEMMREPEEMRTIRGRTARDIREEMDRRTNEEEIDRRHGWRREAGMGGGGRLDERRAFGGGAPGAYGGSAGSQYGSDYYGTSGGYGGPGSGGYGQSAGGAYGGYGSMTGGSYGGSREGYEGRGGFSGYGGDSYGGSYGGMGPGASSAYRPAGGMAGGASGYGSMMGNFGDTAGWDAERMGMRHGAYGLHTMIQERGLEERGRGRGMERGRRGWQREGPMVRDLMTRDPKSVHPDANVIEAARLMREEDAGIMPVVQDGRVLGVVTDRDLAIRVLAEGRNPHEVKVSEVMSTDVHVCTPDDRITDAVRIMGEENVRRLPVVDRDDRLKGIVSMTDVAREAEMDYALQEALEQIASRRSFWSRW